MGNLTGNVRGMKNGKNHMGKPKIFPTKPIFHGETPWDLMGFCGGFP